MNEARHALAGFWTLLAFDLEYQDTGEKHPAFAEQLVGCLVFQPEGRMMAVITAGQRTVAAYSGLYRVEADKWITRVDVSWNGVWTGTEQVRYFTLAGSRLRVRSDWGPSPRWPERSIRRLFEWQRSPA